MRIRFDLTDLQLLVHACDGGSLTAAARRAHLTLAAVSARIRRLEARTGQRLLERRARGVVPTAAGRAWLAHAHQVLAQVEAATTDEALAAAADDGAGAPIVLLGNTSALARPLAVAVSRLLARCPGVGVQLQERTSHLAVEAVRATRADYALVSDAVSAEGLPTWRIARDPLVAVLPAGDALAREGPVDLRTLAQRPWVTCGADRAITRHLAWQSLSQGLRITTRVQAPHPAAALDLVAQGFGVTVMPDSALPALRPADVAVLALDEPWARRHLVLCAQASARYRAEATALARDLVRAWSAAPTVPDVPMP